MVQVDLPKKGKRALNFFDGIPLSPRKSLVDILRGFGPSANIFVPSE